MQRAGPRTRLKAEGQLPEIAMSEASDGLRANRRSGKPVSGSVSAQLRLVLALLVFHSVLCTRLSIRLFTVLRSEDSGGGYTGRCRSLPPDAHSSTRHCFPITRTHITPSTMRLLKPRSSQTCSSRGLPLGELIDRRAQTGARTKELRSLLDAAAKIAQGKACVYATGSFGRREASAFSDLDVFIVAKCDKPPEPEAKRQSVLNPLDGILIKAELIRVGRHLRFPDFTGDGRYLVQYSVKDFTETLGTPEDDVTNTFTARLLLLLESCPLVGSAVYDDVIDEVVSEYWRDYEGHKNDFIPAFLANDILRLWRTLCVNYEARTERTPELEKAKRKLKNSS